MKLVPGAEIKVKVYRLRPPYFNKQHFSYTKKFCSLEEANQYIAECEMAHINFDNYMGVCRRDRRFFKLELRTIKRSPFEFNYIEPQVARQW